VPVFVFGLPKKFICKVLLMYGLLVNSARSPELINARRAGDHFIHGDSYLHFDLSICDCRL